MHDNYRNRMMKARDPRFAKIAGKLYGTRALEAEKPAPIVPADDLSFLRAEYQRVIGKRPFNGWKADELRAKIAAAKA